MLQIPWKEILSIAARVGAAVLTAVPVAEQLGTLSGGKNGAAKAAAVLQLAIAELQAASAGHGRDLSRDPRALEAVRRLVEDAVELHNALAGAAAREAR